MTQATKTKPCKMCGEEFPIEELSSKGFCDKCIVRRMLHYHEKAAEHYHKVLEEMGK